MTGPDCWVDGPNGEPVTTHAHLRGKCVLDETPDELRGAFEFRFMAPGDWVRFDDSTARSIVGTTTKVAGVEREITGAKVIDGGTAMLVTVAGVADGR